jgi:hypothetical protein
MLPTKFQYIWPNGFRGEESKKSANQNQKSPVAAMSVNGSGQNEQSIETAWSNEPKLGSMHLCRSSIKITHFVPIN